MIIAHAIIGILPVDENRFSWFWLLGSVLPDTDHLFILVKNKIFSWKKIIDSIANEEKYNITYKTKYLHSAFGALTASLIIFLISPVGSAYFFIGYVLHLVLDFPDKDEKEYFYPLKIKVKGWLPIFSKLEVAFTIILLIVAIKIYV
jgi:hypothetical protein